MKREKTCTTSPFRHNKFYFHPKNTHTLVICELLSLNTHLKQKVTYGNHRPIEGRNKKKKKKKEIPEMHHPAKNNTTRPIPKNQNILTF